MKKRRKIWPQRFVSNVAATIVHNKNKGKVEMEMEMMMVYIIPNLTW